MTLSSIAYKSYPAASLEPLVGSLVLPWSCFTWSSTPCWACSFTSSGPSKNIFRGVTPVLAVGSNLITGGVFILLDCKACKNGGSQDTSDVEEIIAGGSGSMLYGSAHSFPLDVWTGVIAGVIDLDKCEDLVSLGLHPLSMFYGGILAASNSCSYGLLIARFSGGTRPNSKVE
jgi:hypothetical protein